MRGIMTKNKFLIINADDFGMSREFNLAIRDLMNNQSITTTSIMANGLAFSEAVSFIKGNRLQNIGVHLTLTRDNFLTEAPLLYRNISPAHTLLDKNGNLYTAPEELKRKATFRDIVTEVCAQISLVREAGIEFTHIDNHMYSLMPRMGLRGYQAFFSAYRKEASNDFCGVRIAKSFYISDGLNYIWSGRKILPYIRMKMRQLKLVGPDYSFAFPYYAEKAKTMEQKRELYEHFLKNLHEGITELHIHPCVYSNQLRSYNPYWKNRVHEYNLFMEYDKAKLQNEFGIELISYRDILEML